MPNTCATLAGAVLAGLLARSARDEGSFHDLADGDSVGASGLDACLELRLAMGGPVRSVGDLDGDPAESRLDLRDVVSEIDINPLLVFDQGEGARVVDCLIVPGTNGAA